jgi:2-oxoisovalerate dehydrogenase E2 component (dihydrolipoyl transacylase)
LTPPDINAVIVTTPCENSFLVRSLVGFRRGTFLILQIAAVNVVASATGKVYIKLPQHLISIMIVTTQRLKMRLNVRWKAVALPSVAVSTHTHKQALLYSCRMETRIPFSSWDPGDMAFLMTNYDHESLLQHHQTRRYHNLFGPKESRSTKTPIPHFQMVQHRQFLASALPQRDDNIDFGDSSSKSTKATPFLLADIGEGIAEVELMQWFVQPGDNVQQFDRICEVQSDKATVEITSRYDGTVTSLEHAVGDMVKVGEALMYILAEADDQHLPQAHIDKDQPPDISGRTHDEEQLHIPTIASQYHFESDIPIAGIGQSPAYHGNNSSKSSRDIKVLTSPAIRKLAKEHNLALSTIVGTGPKGRVSKGDVLTVLKERGMVPSGSTPSVKQDHVAPLPPPKQTSASAPVSSITGISRDQHSLLLEQDTIIPLRGYNRLMAATMTASLEIPHMMFSDEVNLNKFFQYKAFQKQQDDPTKRLAFLPLCIKAASKALEHYPLLNSSFDSTNNQVTLWKDHNIGIAMDTPHGLIVPVLKRCQDKSIPELTEELQRLKMAASQRTVDADDLKGATFTLSNIGAIGAGGKYMCPVVTPPQVAIGAIGKIERLPRFVGNTMDVEEAHICVISWGGDHRVVDGATMARFHTQWKEYMEDPIRLVMAMK